MWIDIFLAVMALLGVVYGTLGAPSRQGKLTRFGRAVITTAVVALGLSVYKSVADAGGRQNLESQVAAARENTEKIPSLLEQIDHLRSENASMRRSSERMEKKTLQLLSEVKVITRALARESQTYPLRLNDALAREQKLKNQFRSRPLSTGALKSSGAVTRDHANALKHLDNQLAARLRQLDRMLTQDTAATPQKAE